MNYSGTRFDEEQPRQRKHSSKFEERGDGARKLLDALQTAAEEGGGVLSWSDLDAARDMVYSYNFDDELSPAQVKYAKAIIRRYRRSTEDSVV